MARIVILGGGLTGLSAAYHLEQQGEFDYCLFEREATTGGLARSVQHEGFTFDYTGHLLHISDPYFRGFIDSIIGSDNLVEHQRHAFVWSNNRYTPYPFQEHLAGLPPAVIAECIEGFVKRTNFKNPVSFYTWVLKYFGAGLGRHFFFPYNEKLLCQQAKKLSATWTNRFVPTTTLETIISNLDHAQPHSKSGYNSTFYYPKTSGIGSFTSSLCKQLKNPVKTNHEVVEVHTSAKQVIFANGHTEPYDTLISTLPLPALLGMLTPVTPLNAAKHHLHAVSVLNINQGTTLDPLSCPSSTTLSVIRTTHPSTKMHWVYVPEKQYPFYRFGFWHHFSPTMTPTGHGSLYAELSYRHETTNHETIKQLADVTVTKLLELLHLDQSQLTTRCDLNLPTAYVIYDQWREKHLPSIHKALNDLSIHSIGRFGKWEYSSMQEAVLQGRDCAYGLDQRACGAEGGSHFRKGSPLRPFAHESEAVGRSGEEKVVSAQANHQPSVPAYALVTGGAGFIGSHIVEALVAKGVRVRVLDNLSSGNLDNLATVKNNIEFMHGDIRDATTCKQATAGVSYIFHTAALVSVPGSIENPKRCHQINVIGTQTLLDAAAAQPIPPSIVFSSSSAVYGIRDTPCSESDRLNPCSPYAESKVLGEQLCKSYSETTNTPCVSFRYFNVYGPRQNPNGPYAGVVAKFRHNLLNHEPIVIYGNGLQTRDFIHVTSIAARQGDAPARGYHANHHCTSLDNCATINHEKVLLAPLYDVFNLASGKSITLLELIRQLELETGTYNAGITFLPARPGDILHSQADCSKYQKLLAYHQRERYS